MITTHTPGPWRVEDPPINDHGASLAIMGPGKADRTQLYIAEVWKIDDNAREMEMDAEGKANARLIASAPKMLAALKDILDFLSHAGYDTRVVKEAIQEAEGE